MGHAWYLDCEMQMFVIILLVIYPLWKWGKSPPYAGIIEAGKKHVLFIDIFEVGRGIKIACTEIVSR